MGDTAILLQYDEDKIPQIQGGYPDKDVAPYSYDMVDANNLPAGDHVPVGTINGVTIYVADECVDVSGNHMVVVDGKFDGGSGHDDRIGFNASDLGDFLGENRESIDQAIDGQEPDLCHIASATMEPLYEQVGGTAPGMSVKI